jgi:DNA-binding NarL/FixJ family response regulator
VVAEGLASLLSHYPGITVVGWAETAEDAVLVAEAENVNVVVIDSRLTAERWSQAASAIRAQRPGTAVVLVNAAESDEMVVDAVEAGVAGYLSKSASVAEVAAVVRRAVNGMAQLPARTLAAVLTRQREEGRRRAERSKLLGRLTPREREVLRMMARGVDNRAMAARLGIGYSTVRSHVRGVLEKLGAHSKLEAVAVANGLDLLADQPP